MLKIVNYVTIKENGKMKETDCGGASGIGRWPPTSPWIIYNLVEEILSHMK